MKKSNVLFFFVFISACCLYGQVTGPGRLTGKYNGDEKKGLAHGKGSSIGIDTYEGDYKKGFPHGEGLYIFGKDTVIGETIYRTGYKYEGFFDKGTFEGKGKLIYNNPDSLPKEGYWSNGEYIGKTRDGYEVLISKNIVRVECRYDGSSKNDIEIRGIEDIVEVDHVNIEFNGHSGYIDLPENKFPMTLHVKGTVSSTGARVELKVWIERPGTWTIIITSDSLDPSLK